MLKNNWADVSAAIYGCSGEQLTERERAFFKEANPFGFILFARNCRNPEQITRLVRDLKECVQRDVVPVLIDQEGGRVMRLTPPHWRAVPAAGTLAALVEERGVEAAAHAVYLNARLIATDLHALGINVDCAPLLDVPAPGSHDIIGDRAYGRTPEQVITLGRAMAQGLLDGGVLTVIKHIPGHGRAMADSHLELPVVDTPLDVLREIDFKPFKALKDQPFAMTAHVLYTAIDKEQVATFSPAAIKLIREEIGFDGLLMSDDFSMKALTGSFGERVQRTFSAGCDLALHCNGEMSEMVEIAAYTPKLEGEALRRLEKVLPMLREPDEFDVTVALAELEDMLPSVKVA